jgi:hypothetical protein
MIDTLRRPQTKSPSSILVQYDSWTQCCGSGMFISDPKTATKERGEKIFVVIPSF